MKRYVTYVPLTLCLLASLGCARPPQGAPSGSTQQWEYKVVQLDKGEERDLGVLLNVLAKEGWEFVGQITTEERHIVFKRSIAPRFGAMTIRTPGAAVTTAVARPVGTGTMETRPAPRPTSKGSTVKETRPVRPVPAPKPPPPPAM